MVQVTPKDLKRFWSKVKKTNNCWEWTGFQTKEGYGRFWFKGKSIPTHHFPYIIEDIEIPKGMHLDHLCRNTICVNKKHTEIVTPTENTLRGIGPTAINAKKTHCIHDHELSGENLIITKKGNRQCKRCSDNNNLNFSLTHPEYSKQRHQKIKNLRF